MDKLIELSDHPWIQERWKPREGDWWVWGNGGSFSTIDSIIMRVIKSNLRDKRKNQPIYLPLGFNPETGNWQVDDLILEAGDFENTRKLAYGFGAFIDKQTKEDFALLANNDLILKLTWLRELLDKEVG